MADETDEDSSAERWDSTPKMLGPPKSISEYETEDSVIVRPDEDNYSTTGLEVEYVPSLEPIKQTPEDTDASF